MRHFINGVQVTPRNIGKIGVRSVFSDRIDELSSNVDSITLGLKDYAELIEPHLNQLGYFEGIPYDMVLNSGITLNYYINLKETPVKRTYDVDVKIKKRKGIDQFWENADGTSFELIKSKGFNFNTFDVPYIIVKDNQAEMAISLAITLFLMVKEAIDATKQVITSISDLIGSITPNVGAGVTMDIGDIITQVIKIIFQIAYLALLLAAIINLSKQLFELLFPKIRYFSACKAKELLRVGCQYLGYNFSSTLLDSLPGLTVLPKPLKKQQKKWFDFKQDSLNLAFNKGYPTASDTTPTVGRLLEALRVQFNGRVRIIGNTVHLERRDYWATITQNSFMPKLVLQDTRQDEFTVNTDEGWKRYYIYYQSDISDLHTYDNFEGVDAEYSAEPINVTNADLVSITGYRDVNIPFALGARKNKLNWLEELAKSIFKAIDKVINTFGGNSSLVSKIENRIGVLVISQQYFNITKMLYTVAGKQPVDYLTKIRASALFDNYHTINRIEVNGFKIREGVPIPINDQDFVNLIDNNYFDADGVIMEIEEDEYIEDDHKLLAKVREPYNYASGKIKTIQING